MQGVVEAKMRKMQRVYISITTVLLLACLVIGFLPEYGASCKPERPYRNINFLMTYSPRFLAPVHCEHLLLTRNRDSLFLRVSVLRLIIMERHLKPRHMESFEGDETVESF